MMKMSQEQRAKEEAEEVRRTANPAISTASRFLAQDKEDKDVVSRLYERQKEYDAKGKQLREKLLAKVIQRV